jgi:hypothetical protein
MGQLLLPLMMNSRTCARFSSFHHTRSHTLTHISPLPFPPLPSWQLGDKRLLMQDCDKQIAEILADDKQLNHNFKKEFIDAEPYYAKLLHLYRYRSVQVGGE